MSIIQLHVSGYDKIKTSGFVGECVFANTNVLCNIHRKLQAAQTQRSTSFICTSCLQLCTFIIAVVMLTGRPFDKLLLRKPLICRLFSTPQLCNFVAFDLQKITVAVPVITFYSIYIICQHI